MGNKISNFFNFKNWFFKIFENKKCSIIMVGLDSSGKTTILNYLKDGETQERTIPTIGFNNEMIKYKNIQFNIFDLGGQDKIRCLWKNYYENVDVIIFVIDSHDIDRIKEVKKEINKIFQNDLLNDCIVLFFANKQDLPNCLDREQIIKKLNIQIKNDWFIQPCCAVTGQGIEDGFNWICKKNNIK